MRWIQVAGRGALFVAVLAAAWSTFHAIDAWPPHGVWDGGPWFRIMNAASGWLVAALAIVAWSKRPVWAGWAAGFTGLGAAILAFATIDSGVFGIFTLRGATALLLAPQPCRPMPR